MPPTFITLDQIEFAKKGDDLDLSAPLYKSRILYDVIDPEVAAHLQVEPAFQFVSPPAADDLYFFDFKLAENSAEFSLDGDQLRTKTSPVATEIIESVTEINSRYCRVKVKPAAWFNDDSPSVVTLRLFCSLAGQRQKTHSNYGVNLVLLKPGGTAAKDIKSPVPNQANSDFTIKVIGLHEDPVFPKYHIFNYAPPLPHGISLEPVFRIGNARPAANVTIELAPSLGKAFKMDGADVRVLMRNPPWPNTLSKVQGGDQAVAFSADAAAEKAGGTIRTFSFLMELADPAPQMWTIATSSTPDLAVSAAPRPRPIRWPEVHVDPIVLQEPIPTGLP